MAALSIPLSRRSFLLTGLALLAFLAPVRAASGQAPVGSSSGGTVAESPSSAPITEHDLAASRQPGSTQTVLPRAGQPPATILLIRHAEKLTDGQMDLSPIGFERARLLPQLFGGPGIAPPHNLPRPDLLFATHVSKKSNRPVETITPLSHALSLPIGTEVDDKDFATLATQLLSGAYAGKVVLVAWHHGTLPQFAEALGAVPPYQPWPDMQFDRVWRIDFRDGKAVLSDLPQGLLPGDSK